MKKNANGHAEQHSNEPGTTAVFETPRERVPGPQTLLLTMAEVASHLRVSRRQAHRLLSSGRLYPADVSLGGLRGRRWRSDRLQAWIEAGCPKL